MQPVLVSNGIRHCCSLFQGDVGESIPQSLLLFVSQLVRSFQSRLSLSFVENEYDGVIIEGPGRFRLLPHPVLIQVVVVVVSPVQVQLLILVNQGCHRSLQFL